MDDVCMNINHKIRTIEMTNVIKKLRKLPSFDYGYENKQLPGDKRHF